MNGLDWTAIIVAFIALIGTLFNGILFYKARKREKQRKQNPPGKIIAMGNGQRSFLCMLHAEKLTKLEIKMQKSCDDIRELKDEIKDIKNTMVVKRR